MGFSLVVEDCDLAQRALYSTQHQVK